MNDSPKISPRDFFIYLLAAITLASFASSLIRIGYQLIDDNNFWPTTLRWGLSSLIVTFPLYLYLIVRMTKESRVISEPLESKVRKWFINFTLFIITMIALCDVGLLVNDLLKNNLNSLIFIKTLWLWSILGFIFLFYYRELDKKWTSIQLKIIFWTVLSIIILVIVCGVYKLKQPYQSPNTLMVQNIKSNATISRDSSTYNVGVVAFCKDKGLQPNKYEARILQKLIPQFALSNQCEIGGCVAKWNDHATSKFSLPWKSACGYGGIGDEGRGSTFVCEYNIQDNTTCCSPLGFPQSICMIK
jgi:hypothetical protein